MNNCRNPNAHRCSCDSCHAESMNVRRMRNDALYRETVNPDTKVNPIITWMNSEEWTEPNSIFTACAVNGHTYTGHDITLHNSGVTSGEITCS